MQEDQLQEIVKENKNITPCYVFDTDELCGRIRGLQEKLPSNAELCYAVKANPFLLLPMDDIMGKYEVCSPGELRICQGYRIKPEKIVFSGVNKRKEEIGEAIRYGVGIITLESMQQYRYVKECVQENGKGVRVLPRLTSGAQFGMDAEELERIIEECQNDGRIQVAGIHYFTGTQKKKADRILEEAAFLLTYAQELRRRMDFMPEILEYGAGIAVPYFEGDDFEGQFLAFERLAEFVKNEGGDFCWTLELGRYLAASCGYYLTGVVDRKKNQGKNFCLVDGGIHHLNYYGQNMAMRVPRIAHFKAQSKECCGEVQEWCVCGSLCTFADILVRKIALADLENGDVLAFQNAGAYSVTEAIHLLLSRRMPGIYFYSRKQGLRLVRKPLETFRLNGGELISADEEGVF